MFCKNCGKEFSGKFCPECGESAAEQKIVSAQQKKPPSGISTPVIILLLFVFFPVGLYFMWKSNWNKNIKIAVSVLFAITAIAVALDPDPKQSPSSGHGSENGSSSRSSLNSISSSQNSSSSVPEIDPQLKKLLDGSMSETQAKNYLKVAELCEIERVSGTVQEIPKASVSDMDAFSVDTKDGIFLIGFNTDGSINFATDEAGQNLYSEGKINKNFVFWERFTYFNLQNYVKEVINSGLVSPSTAQYPGGGFLDPYEGWTIGRKQSNMYLASYVDSQNGFGAMIRTNFECELGSAGDGKMTMLYLKTNDTVQVDNRK